MSDNKVISMADRSDSGLIRTPKDSLEKALRFIEEEQGVWKDAKKILIICLDDNEMNYEIEMLQAGMKSTESVCLMRVAETMFLCDMGYIQ